MFGQQALAIGGMVERRERDVGHMHQRDPVSRGDERCAQRDQRIDVPGGRRRDDGDMPPCNSQFRSFPTPSGRAATISMDATRDSRNTVIEYNLVTIYPWDRSRRMVAPAKTRAAARCHPGFTMDA